MKVYVFLSDLHVGGLIDYRALEWFVIKSKDVLRLLKPDERILVITGDITEGSNIHKYQQLVIHPAQQVRYAAYVLKWIYSEVGASELVVLPGNHDQRSWEGKKIIVELVQALEQLKVDIEVVREGHVLIIGRKKVMLRHMIGNSSGSYVGGITPKIFSSGLIYAREYNVDVVVCGHYHVFSMTPEVILLPSFQYSDDPKYWSRGGLIWTDSDLRIPVITRQMTFYNSNSDFDALEEWLYNVKMRVTSRESSTVRICKEWNGYRKCRVIDKQLYEKIRVYLSAGLPIKRIARILGVDPGLVRIVRDGYKC